MSEELFSVHQFFPDDFSETVGERLPGEEAVAMAKRLTESVGGRIGTTKRVIITDSQDFTVFEWRFGEGVVFPPRDAAPDENAP